MKVAVIGCGPAGLLAALAVEEAGHEPDLISRKQKSIIGGAQYIHESIPWLTDGMHSEEVTTVKLGTREGYAFKVYGDASAKVELGSLQRADTGLADGPAVSEVVGPILEPCARHHGRAPRVGARLMQDMIICSAPRWSVCRAPDVHEFHRQTIYLGHTQSIRLPENTIMYSGRAMDNWTRISNLFGANSVEWSDASWEPDHRPVIAGAKPLGHTCDCHPEVKFVGRFGRWEKGAVGPPRLPRHAPGSGRPDDASADPHQGSAMRCTECSKPVKPIVAIDIDGTLGDYHGHFLTFAELYLGADGVVPLRFTGVYNYDPPQDSGSNLPLPSPTPFKDWFMAEYGVDERTWRDIKLAYRQGGMKRSMPVYDGADWLCQQVRYVGAELWLTTTRPFLRLDNVDPDTRFWLGRQGIEYDGLLYDENKYQVLAESVDPDRVVMVLDDLGDMVKAADHWFPSTAILRRNDYNRSVQWSWTKETLAECTETALARVRSWRETHE